MAAHIDINICDKKLVKWQNKVISRGLEVKKFGGKSSQDFEDFSFEN
jgi:hypothetical protein